MHFDELLAGVENDSLVIPASWGQGRATFGGLVAALTFLKMQAAVQPGRPLRALQVAFVGPVTVDEPVSFEVELLREGRAASQVQGRLVQGGEVRLSALASFGGDRESSVQVSPDPAPEAPAPEQCPELGYIAGMTPEFTRHIEMRWAFGHFPFAGRPVREMGGWMRFREAGEAMGDAHVIALVDAWPPAVLQHLKQPAPASSMSWSLEIVHPRPEMKADEPLLYRAVIDQAGGGYGHTHATIWNGQGELVALSRQTVTVFG
ncbi:thioesterase family protein [Marinobacter halodurans]|uniref:Thioesterase family protein n=1 Tax=Marinobacter halodurans TaxID=2528979 RepID=A0ABY1ZKZ0_9GAMM|nr:thioesterase family protein [Marinobacter halodurans]TBW56229.1 thioesterase family protein [Marinobacter halodurans]